MPDDLRTRIAAVICGMDALHAKQWSLAVADSVIRELEAAYVLVPKSRTLASNAFKAFKYGEHYGI